ncbi:hypothetical protein ANCCAN_09274 [Ancylostoma caninum]|uniref:Uncharacterized protein n=1 Tax=Ancylostoma caninum TaxID=29170 RepID=A0A368GN38_ANCCA|nr:hypothetical protein ANCCAN_09274 [Ancylostoma caninum]
MRQHRLAHRGSASTTTSPAISTIPTSLSLSTLDHPVSSSESHNNSTVLVRPPVARAYRFKKETSICGLTCSCCFHTILGTVKRRKVSDSGTMTTNNNNVLTAMSVNIVPGGDIDGKPPADERDECSKDSNEPESSDHLSENYESLSHENPTDASNSSQSLSLSAEKAPFGASFSADRPASVGFVTKQKDGEQVQIAAKAPRRRSINAIPTEESGAAVPEEASCLALQSNASDLILQSSTVSVKDMSSKNAEHLYAISETPKITSLWKLRHRRVAAESSPDVAGPSSAAIACTTISESSTTEKAKERELTPRITRSMAANSTSLGSKTVELSVKTRQ